MKPSSPVILLVEDSEDDAFAMRRALKKSEVPVDLREVTDGRQAIEYLEGSGKYSDREQYPQPTHVFLDLKLPYVSGFEVLVWLRKQPTLCSVKVAILTGSDERRDHEKANDLGANYYLVKPAEPLQILGILEADGSTAEVPSGT